jgi:hypothetical protein
MVSRTARLVYLRRKVAHYPTVNEGTWAPDFRDFRLVLGAQSQSGIFGEKNIFILLSGLEPRLGFV